MKPQLSKSLPINKTPDDNYFAKHNLENAWYMSEKFDGIRAIWTGEKLLTRSGREFRYVPEWFLEKLPSGFPLDGEIYVPNEYFGYFSSLSIQTKSEKAEDKWRKVIYIIFDSPRKDKTFEERLDILKLNTFPDFVDVVAFQKIKDIKNFGVVNQTFDAITGRGGEGVMLIKADSGYEFGKRSKYSLKYKKITDGEATVIELCEGKGKYKTFLGKLKCQLHNGKTFYCGTGFDDNQRKSYKFGTEIKISPVENAVCPVVGDVITYTCMEMIKKTKIPRMSVFKGIRTDL